MSNENQVQAPEAPKKNVGHKFKKGDKKPPNSGRQKGTPNKFTTTMKQAVMDTFEALGGVTHMTKWAKKKPNEFYKLAGKTIPHEITGKDGAPIEQRVRFIQVPAKQKPNAAGE